MLILTDILEEPFDEGAKIATLNLSGTLKETHKATIFAINTKQNLSCVDKHFRLNKFLFNLRFYRAIKKTGSTVLYIPEASITFFSFIRAKLLQMFSGADVFMLSLQPRSFNFVQRYIVKAIAPSCVITQSADTAKYLSKIGVNNNVLPLGVDSKKYCQFDTHRKRALRNRHKIEQDRTVLLHVGHIQKSRNLEWLLNVKERMPHVEIVIVGSTFNQDDQELFNTLREKGVRIIRKFTPNMEDIYNLADYYVFPVLQNDGAIETPLSVLEAMACNLPVITSQFGSLPDVFQEDKDFHYVKSSEEIIKIIETRETSSCNNRAKMEPFTWGKITRQLVSIIGE